MQVSLLRKSPRHIHTALPHTEQNWEGKVQEIGPDPLQVPMIVSVLVWCKPVYLQGRQWNCSSCGCLRIGSEAL